MIFHVQALLIVTDSRCFLSSVLVKFSQLNTGTCSIMLFPVSTQLNRFLIVQYSTVSFLLNSMDMFVAGETGRFLTSLQVNNV